MKEHLKKIKETIDVERGYSLGTVFTTRNKQYMYDTGTGKVFECGANEYQILKSLFEETSLPEKVEGSLLWSSIFVTLMANKIGGLQFGIYRNCQISSRVFHTAVAALPLTKANRSDFE